MPRDERGDGTGVYWIPIYEILEARGFEVHLVNARHVKNVPGRKSDVSDCEWLRELHSVGLLRGIFRPTDAIVGLRTYLGHRQTLIETAGRAEIALGDRHRHGPVALREALHLWAHISLEEQKSRAADSSALEPNRPPIEPPPSSG